MKDTFWRRCSSCKRELAFDANYYVCSVSTCNRKGSSYVFCSVQCWDAHMPVMRHRSAWAEEKRSPTRAQWAATSKPATSRADHSKAGTHATRMAHAGASAASSDAPSASPVVAAQRAAPESEIPHDILIVASRLKDYVRARSGLNTSESVLVALSERVRALCDDAITRAREEGRKTLMDRDF